MLSDEVRVRLERLNRERLPAFAPSTVASDAHDRSAKPPAPPPLVPAELQWPSPAGDGAGFDLAALIPGAVEPTDEGVYYRIHCPLVDLWREGARLLADHETLRSERSGQAVDREHADLDLLAEAFPDGTLFLDLETCGFAGAPVFLVGLIHAVDGKLALEQLLARDYTEERAMLAALWRRAETSRVLATFNGKSFDWPMVHDRTVYHHLAPAASALRMPHVDLLHHARRRWRRWLPNCKLQTLERAICRRVRNDDIPGSLIPHEYHHFVRSGDARQMQSILHHNALDLVTLAQLAMRLTG